MRYPLTALLALICTFLPGAATAQRALTANDHIDIQQLYARYNDAIDSGNAGAWADTFTADGAFNTFKGRQGLMDFMAQWTGRMNGANLRHWNTNLVITPTSEGASGSVYLILLDVSVRPPAIASTVRYNDTLVRTAQGWRFKTRTTRADPAPRQ